MMMMSKKMKRVSEESSSYGGYEDAKARMKHQVLLQDFQELEKETNDLRDKLEDSKKRKLILLAEVRFLRRRHSYLLEVKSMERPKENKLEAHLKTGPKSARPNKKDPGPRKLPPPAPRPKPTGGVVTGRKETTPPSVKQHKWQKNSSGGKEPVLAGLSSAPESIDLNLNDRLLYGTNSADPRVPLFDLNKESGLSWKDVSPPSRVPFDLNEISTEEEPRWNFEPAAVAEENTRSLMRGGGVSEDQQGGDLRISLCRNAGGEGTSRARKPKISWQDPVALRV